MRALTLTDRIVDRASKLLGRRISRRGLIARTTILGSAVAATGCVPITQQGSPFTFITDCPPGSMCRDGYTEFCCVINAGQNACPPGSIPSGWWRADFSVFCNGTRYYIDCNDYSGGGPCRCSHGCDYRKVYCNHFRYGQCNQQVPGTGVIACRMVTCVPPYLIPELNCVPSGAVDNATAGHFTDCAPFVPPPPAPPPPPPPSSPPAVAVPLGGAASPAPGEVVVTARIGGGSVGVITYAGGAWSTWTTLPLSAGRQAASRVVAVSPALGVVDVFVVADDDHLWWQHFEGGIWASEWTNLGGVLRSDPAAVAIGGEVHVLVRNLHKATLHFRRSGGTWSVTNLGGISTSDPAVAALGGEVHAFVRGTNSQLFTRRWNGSWVGDWEDLNGIVTSDSSASSDASTTWVFVRGTGQGVYYKRRGASWPNAWQELGGISTSDPVSVVDEARVWVFVRGSDNLLYARRREGGTWSGWQSLGRPSAGGLTTDPLAVFDGTSVVVFARVGVDLYARRITNGAAGPWEALPTGVSVIPVRGAKSA